MMTFMVLPISFVIASVTILPLKFNQFQEKGLKNIQPHNIEIKKESYKNTDCDFLILCFALVNLIFNLSIKIYKQEQYVRLRIFSVQ